MGPNFVFPLDGHDKLCGYQNWTFPICIYGCSDTATRKLMFVKVWTSNNDPILPAKWYLNYLYSTRMLPHYLRFDHDTENRTIATIHAYLRDRQTNVQNEDETCGAVIHESSTENQV